MRRLLAIALVATACRPGPRSTPEPPPPKKVDPAAFELTEAVSLARDDGGPFAWIPPGRSPGVAAPEAVAATFRASRGDLEASTSTRADDKRVYEFSVDDLAVDDVLEILVDGEVLRSFRLRRPTDENGGAAFFAAIAAADAGYRKDWQATADAWLEIGTSTGIFAQGERSKLLRKVAFVDIAQGRFERARSLLVRAQELAAIAEDRIGTMRVLYYQGELFRRTGAYLEAARRYEEAIHRDEIGNGSDGPTSRFRLASTLGQLGRFGEALEVIAAARAFIPAVDLPYLEHDAAKIRRGAMEAGLIPVDLEALRSTYRRLGRYHENAGRHTYVAYQIVERVALDLDLGDVASARRGLARLDALGDHVVAALRGSVAILRARTDLESNEPKAALRRLRRIVTSTGAGPAPCAAYDLIGEVHWRTNDVPRALAAHRQAVGCIEAAADTLDVVDIEASFRHGRRGLYHRLASRLIDAKRTEEAFAVIDGARSSVLEARVRAVDIDANVDAWIILRDARAALDRATDEGCASRVTASSRRACHKQLAAREVEARRARDDFERGIPDRPTVDRNARWIERVRAALGRRRALLVVIGHDAAARFLWVDGRGVTAVARPLERLGADIEHLYVVPDWHPRAFDPFDEVADDGPLATKVGMSFLPHANVLLEAHPTTGGPSVVIADPDGTLPRSAREGAAIAEMLPQARLLDVSPTRGQVLEAWSSAGVVHYAGHASTRHRDPWSVRLHLGGRTYLSTFDILVAKGRPNLVVLNGCTTGPPLRAGGGGFVAAVVQAGTAAVLATVRGQADGASTPFVRDFYTFGGLERPAEAFRAAASSAHRKGDDAWRTFRLWGAVGAGPEGPRAPPKRPDR